MTLDKSLRINSPDVVSETIDGETVIMNLYKGLYYNLNLTGSFIWTSLEAGVKPRDIMQAFEKQNPQEEIFQASIVQLCDRLIAEELVVESDAEPASEMPALEALASFEAPVLYKYTDMQDLLALDPIHDVDKTGWPNQPAELLGASNF